MGLISKLLSNTSNKLKDQIIQVIKQTGSIELVCLIQCLNKYDYEKRFGWYDLQDEIDSYIETLSDDHHKYLLFICAYSNLVQEGAPHRTSLFSNAELVLWIRKSGVRFEIDELKVLLGAQAQGILDEENVFIVFSDFEHYIHTNPDDSKFVYEIEEAQELLCQSIEKSYYGNKEYILKKIEIYNAWQILLGDEKRIILYPSDDYASEAIGYFNDLSDNEKERWQMLIGHIFTLKGTRPTASWNKKALTILHSFQGHFQESAEKFLNLFLKVTTTKRIYSEESKNRILQGTPRFYLETAHDEDEARQKYLRSHLETYKYLELNTVNVLFLKGLIYCFSLEKPSSLTKVLSEIAKVSYRKMGERGIIYTTLGNACIDILGQIGSNDAIVAILHVLNKVKNKSVKKTIHKTLENIAKNLGISQEDLLENTLPDYGLQLDGTYTQTLGEYTAALSLSADGVNVSWSIADKVVKTLPKLVKEMYGQELNAIKEKKKAIVASVATQKDTIQNLYRREKSWSFAEWHKLYMEHPVRRSIAKSLIWKYSYNKKETDILWNKDRFITLDSKEFFPEQEGTIALWHPLFSALDDIKAWRVLLQDLNVFQPFKQAFREVYVLTDAEKKTNVYSNRFAAHILKQHQFKSLCDSRGWSYSLQSSYWDGGEFRAELLLPKWSLRVAYYISPVDGDAGTSGVNTYISTDQVCFEPIEQYGERLALETISPIVFSEVMRDVDLFVGVSSVANDPNWRDNPNAAPYQGYWELQAFGDLGAFAKNRKEVLQDIIPKLNIADKCSFEDKFLIVNGKLRTYKIHIGSGNILMQPNDQYLCIVPSGTNAANKVYLPFKDDTMLSIILSKAFLLANDTDITDQTIVSQMRR